MGFTTAEKLENVERTIAATEAKIAELEKVNRANKREAYQLRAKLADERRKESLQNSDKARWDRATKALRKDGVHFRTNINSCCRGCVDEEKLNLKDETKPYGWTFAGQGNRIVWDEKGAGSIPGGSGNSYYSKPSYKVFINHGNGAAKKIVEAFRNEGLVVEWDGKDSSCVEITFASA